MTLHPKGGASRSTADYGLRSNGCSARQGDSKLVDNDIMRSPASSKILAFMSGSFVNEKFGNGRAMFRKLPGHLDISDPAPLIDRAGVLS